MASTTPDAHAGVLDINAVFRSGGRAVEFLDRINQACLVMLYETGIVPREHAQRITLDKERIAHWLKVGAQPSDRVAKFLAQAELMKPRERRDQTKKPQPRAKAQERMKAAAAASTAPAEGEAKEAAAS